MWNLLQKIETGSTNILGSVLGAIVIAVVLLILAFVLAYIAKKIVVKGLKKLNLEKKMERFATEDKSFNVNGLIDFIGKFVYLIIILLFLPSILSRLGVTSISVPITEMITKFLAFIPNIIAAGVIVTVGFFIAKLARQLLVPILVKLGIDKLQGKKGLPGSEISKPFSYIIAYAVYVLILIPVAISALHVLSITALSNPAITILESILIYLPKMGVAIIIAIIGIIISGVIANLLYTVLSGFGIDAAFRKIMPKNSATEKFSVNKVICNFAKILILLIFIIEAVNIIDLAVFVMIGSSIIAYIPMIVAAAFILFVAFILSSWIETCSKKDVSPIIINVLKVLVYVFAAFMILDQLHIATSIVRPAFIIILSAVALATAISFGLGGKDFAKRTLEKIEKKKD